MVFFIQGPTGRELTELKIHGEEFMSIFKAELRVFPWICFEFRGRLQ